ncbi:unnamed protein product [Mesocestoides corti]|uniref:BOD1/SHG1 domain-containing protein n=1 Tax=Mesocestoides corti TaxID=53468 RepID=A0A0R3U7A3_MESCO|nr:unnamed protein product [Mesocestoides corti]
MTESSNPTPEMLMTRLKSQGFFDKIRKRCLEDVECKPDYLYLKRNVVDSIVSQFLSRQCSVGSKLEMRDRLRREIHDNAIFQRSLSQMADRLLATQASPEALAPPINQVACEILDVDYRDWLRRSKKRQTPQPLLPDISIPPPVLAGPPEPLLPDPISTEEDHSHPLSTDVLPAPSGETENQPILACENEVEMEVDDVGDEMDVESTDSNVSVTGYRPKQSLKASGADSYFPEDSVRTKFNQPAPSSIGESSQPTPQPAIANSSSFSRKFSAAVAGWVPNASSKQPGINSDNETNHEDSPLRRRMSLAGQLAKRSSPPVSSPIKPNLDKNPSPLIEGRHRMSSPGQHRDRIRKHGGTLTLNVFARNLELTFTCIDAIPFLGSNYGRHYDNYDRNDYRRFRRNREFQFQRQHSRHHKSDYRNSDRRGRDDGGRSNQSFDRQNYLFQVRSYFLLMSPAKNHHKFCTHVCGTTKCALFVCATQIELF